VFESQISLFHGVKGVCIHSCYMYSSIKLSFKVVNVVCVPGLRIHCRMCSSRLSHASEKRYVIIHYTDIFQKCRRTKLKLIHVTGTLLSSISQHMYS
jgi:hypothetical protein